MQTLAPDVKATQEAKLAELRKVVDAHAQSDLERKLAVRYHKIKFFGEDTARPNCSAERRLFSVFAN